MTRLVLGIDSGGTKTMAAIADETGRVLAIVSGQSANFDDMGIQGATENLRQVVNNARRSAGIADTPFAAAFLGLAGVVSSKDHALAREMALRLALAPPEQIGVDHDCRVALAGGLSGRPGIVLIAGTGSSCFGLNAQGERWLAGGMGHLIADEGSSYWLGIQAMRAAVMSHDGRIAPTPMQGRVQRQLGLKDMGEMLHRLYVEGLSRAEIAALAPIVTEAAAGGDPTALALIQQGASELAECVLAVARRLRLDSGPCEVVLVGGLIGAGEMITGPLTVAIRARLPQSEVKLPELAPVLGGCVLALKMINISATDDEVARNLQTRIERN